MRIGRSYRPGIVLPGPSRATHLYNLGRYLLDTEVPTLERLTALGETVRGETVRGERDARYQEALTRMWRAALTQSAVLVKTPGPEGQPLLVVGQMDKPEAWSIIRSPVPTHDGDYELVLQARFTRAAHVAGHTVVDGLRQAGHFVDYLTAHPNSPVPLELPIDLGAEPTADDGFADRLLRVPEGVIVGWENIYGHTETISPSDEARALHKALNLSQAYIDGQ